MMCLVGRKTLLNQSSPYGHDDNADRTFSVIAALNEAFGRVPRV